MDWVVCAEKGSHWGFPNSTMRMIAITIPMMLFAFFMFRSLPLVPNR